MESQRVASEFRYEKQRADALVTLVGGEHVRGCFFVSAGSATHTGAERISDLLNSENGFFPFEAHIGTRQMTVLYNRAHVIAVAVFDDEARRDPGYSVAPRREVSILLSNGDRVNGVVRVYRPEGRDRVSDWTRQPEIFRYVETTETTLIVNAAHIVAVTEVSGS
jgi:hypothetical protein